MNKNNREFDAVSVDQKNLESLIVFQIAQISSIVNRTSVGQFVKSSPFELNFPISIGKSKWILFLFLNGQYEDGQANELISIYLKLDQCEHQYAKFNFDVTIQFGIGSATVAKKNQRLCFASVKTRWFCAKLIKISEMILNESQFIVDDVLMLTVSIKEHITEAENTYIDPPNTSTMTVPSAKRSRNSMFREEPYASDLHSRKFSRTPSPRNSIESTTTKNAWLSTPSCSKPENASASTNGTGQAYCQNICDNDYINHEFSDEEDVKSVDSKKGIRDTLSNFFKKFR